MVRFDYRKSGRLLLVLMVLCLLPVSNLRRGCFISDRDQFRLLRTLEEYAPVYGLDMRSLRNQTVSTYCDGPFTAVQIDSRLLYLLDDTKIFDRWHVVPWFPAKNTEERIRKYLGRRQDDPSNQFVIPGRPDKDVPVKREYFGDTTSPSAGQRDRLALGRTIREDRKVDRAKERSLKELIKEKALMFISSHARYPVVVNQIEAIDTLSIYSDAVHIQFGVTARGKADHIKLLVSVNPGKAPFVGEVLSDDDVCLTKTGDCECLISACILTRQ